MYASYTGTVEAASKVRSQTEPSRLEIGLKITNHLTKERGLTLIFSAGIPLSATHSLLSVTLFYACAGGAGGRARHGGAGDVFRAMDEDQCALVTTPDHQTPGPSLATEKGDKERESLLWRRLQKLLEKPTEKERKEAEARSRDLRLMTSVV